MLKLAKNYRLFTRSNAIGVDKSFHHGAYILTRSDGRVGIRLNSISLAHFSRKGCNPRGSFVVGLRSYKASIDAISIAFSKAPSKIRDRVLSVRDNASTTDKLTVTVLSSTGVLVPLGRTDGSCDLRDNGIPLAFCTRLQPIGDSIRSNGIGTDTAFMLRCSWCIRRVNTLSFHHFVTTNNK